MKKIVILGCSGSGKSTLSKKLSEKINIPVFHLDKIFWKSGWKEISIEEFDKKLSEELDKEAWIIDGNYGRTIPMRLEKCDTVIYLDYKRSVCIRGVIKRVITNYGKTRDDMGENCPEKFNLEFLRWVWNFNKNNREKYLKMVREVEGKNVYILHSRKEGEELLNKL